MKPSAFYLWHKSLLRCWKVVPFFRWKHFNSLMIFLAPSVSVSEVCRILLGSDYFLEADRRSVCFTGMLGLLACLWFPSLLYFHLSLFAPPSPLHLLVTLPTSVSFPPFQALSLHLWLSLPPSHPSVQRKLEAKMVHWECITSWDNVNTKVTDNDCIEPN